MGSDIKLLVLFPSDCSQSRLPERGAILLSYQICGGIRVFCPLSRFNTHPRDKLKTFETTMAVHNAKCLTFMILQKNSEL